MGTAKKLNLNEYSLIDYIKDISKILKTGKTTEHSFRGYFQSLVESNGKNISALNEPKRIKCGAPDYIVMKGRVPIGYIEAKDLGENLNKVEKSSQLKRYLESLSNLILTNYTELRWYVNGQKRMTINIAEVKGKSLVINENASAELAHLLTCFFNSDVPSISSSEELAKRLAASTKSICDLITQAFEFEDDGGWLHRWRDAFSDVLIRDLETKSFSDMFAQTLTYGFFAARVHHDGKTDFSRFAAAKILPKTNPFLRQLFAEFAGVNMPDEISWAVDEVVQILKRTNMDEIMKAFTKQEGKEDPVVHFYETFLSEYNPKLRETRGVYYTPEPVVDFIVRSSDEILKSKFKKKNGLADDKSLILDPAVGTASFLYKVIEQIHSDFKNKGAWDSYVSDNLLERIYGFEILMAPYSVAHLKLGLQLQDTGYKFQKNQRLGVFLTDTLEDAAKKSQEMLFDWISKEANAASSIKKDKPIMLVLGNPPYSGESANNGEWIKGLLRGYDSINEEKTHNYFECEGKPLGERNPKWLNDDYVKFIRFAQWRIEQTGHGVLSFVTNHGYLDNPTFRGMRESLLKSFDEIYVLDLHGNTKKKEKAPDGSVDQNVFDIQQGVSIGFFVRTTECSDKVHAKVFRADLFGPRADKYDWLKSNSLNTVEWKEITPAAPFYRLEDRDEDLWEEYENGIKITNIFNSQSVGIATGRDRLTIQNTEEAVLKTVKKFANMDTETAREEWNLGKDVQDWKVKTAQSDIINTKASKKLIRPVLYRPFDIRYTYFSGKSRGFICRPRTEVANMFAGDQNVGLITSRMTKGEEFKHIHFTRHMSEVICLSAKTSNNGFVFPLYSSSNDKQMDLSDTKSKFNFKPKAIENFEKNSGLTFTEEIRPSSKFFNGEQLFHYIASVLSSVTYQSRYKDCLKGDFPKIPVPKDAKFFFDISKHGKRLVQAHLIESNGSSSVCFMKKGSNKVESYKFNSKKKSIVINESQSFDKVSSEVWNFYVGGYPVCEKWLKSRKGQKLSFNEIEHFIKICGEIENIIKEQKALENTISAAGGWKKIFNNSFFDTKEIDETIKDAKTLKKKIGKKINKVTKKKVKKAN